MKSPDVAPKSVETEVQNEPRARWELSLTRAAEAAALAHVPADEFGGAAWRAYLAAVPDFAAQLEQAQLVSHLQQLREAGLLPQA